MATAIATTTEDFEFVRVLKFFDRTQQSFLEDDRTSITVSVDDADHALTVLLRPILRAFEDTQVPLIKISMKAAGPFPHAQSLSELDLYFHAAKVEFRIRSNTIPCSLAMIYRKLQDLCDLKFLHLRYVALGDEDERVLREIVSEQKLVVLFLGVVSMQGSELMQALRDSQSIKTVALVWLNLERTGHDFPIRLFCEKLHQFSSINNLVLLPFASDPALWAALNSGLRQSNTLQDVMISGEGGCILHDDLIIGLAANMNRNVTKRLRLNNATLGPRGMEALCNLLANSKVEFLDLSGSAVPHESVAIFADHLPSMTKLRVLDFRESKDQNDKPWSREILKTLLVGLERNKHLEEVILSYTPETSDLKRVRDFYLQRNQSRPMLVETNLRRWPAILSEVGKRDGNSLLFHLLRERVDVMIFATGDLRKRSAESIADEEREAKRAKR